MPRCFSLGTRQLCFVFFNLKATCEPFLTKTNDLIEKQNVHTMNNLFERIVNALAHIETHLSLHPTFLCTTVNCSFKYIIKGLNRIRTLLFKKIALFERNII